jgi:zinc protease
MRTAATPFLLAIFTSAFVATMTQPILTPSAQAASPAPATASVTGARRAPGPAGSLLIVEETKALPIVAVVIAARTGSASDPHGKEGLATLATELARRGAGGRPRAAIDDALDAVGASLDVDVEPDSVRLAGQVLVRNLDPFLDIVADILQAPDFSEVELARTRDELLAHMEEARNDDRSLCGRFFDRQLFGDHPYGHPPEGTAKSLPRIKRDDIVEQHHKTFVGGNLIFAASGGITLEEFSAKIAKRLDHLRPGPLPAQPTLPAPARPEGWRIQLVDKPDRQQTQIMFGQPALPADHPDRLALQLAIASFGGRGMNATLMDEVRSKRGLAYGAYMNLATRRGPSALRGWVFTAKARTVTTLKLVLRLFKKLHKEGLTPERLRFFQGFVAGSYAADLDDPVRRLDGRVTAEVNGLPADEIDTLPARIRALTPEAVAGAIQRHLDPDHLTITLVATADTIVPMLVKAKIEEGAIDVVPFDSY